MSRTTAQSRERRSTGAFHQVLFRATPTSPSIMLNLTFQRTKSMSSKSAEQTLQLPGSSPSQIQNPAVVVEEADVVDVAGAEVVEEVGAGGEVKNRGTKPLTRRLLAMNRPVRRGNATLNPMAVHRPG